MTTNKTQIRFNEETRKAILLGDEYDAFKTLTQFYRQEKALLEQRSAKAKYAVGLFVRKGGIVDYDESTHTAVVSMNDVSYTVTYDSEGGIRRYSVENPAGNEQELLYLHWMFYCSTIFEKLDAAIDEVNIKLKNLENDILIKSMQQTASTLKDDIYLTAGAVAGLDLRSDEDVDPFGLFSDKTGGRRDV